MAYETVNGNTEFVARPTDCPSCGMAPGECYRICPRHEDAYTPEQEREDSLYSESLSDGEHFAEAHAEWHRNSGVPVGQPCPWDVCDPYEGDDGEPVELPVETPFVNIVTDDDDLPF